VPNLYIVDGSALAIAGAVNPTPTISALARRAAEHLRDNFRELRSATKSYPGSSDPDRPSAGRRNVSDPCSLPWLELVCADSGYDARQVKDAKVPGLRIEIAKQSDDMKGFVCCRAAGCRAHFLLVQSKRSAYKGLGEPRRYPRYLRHPRSDPTRVRRLERT
jgi:hypothetical protein